MVDFYIHVNQEGYHASHAAASRFFTLLGAQSGLG